MLAAGIDLRAAAGRPGHAAGGAMTLKVRARRTRPADQRAAELLARELRARHSATFERPPGRAAMIAGTGRVPWPTVSA
jgi:hypothetical protein